MADQVVRLGFRLGAEQAYVEDGTRVGISTADLVAFSRFCDAVGTAVVERAAWRFMASLGASPAEWETVLSRTAAEPGSLAVGQVTKVEDGSIVVLVVISASVIAASLLRRMGEETVIDAWKESARGARVRRALRDGLFGGAAEAVEAAASEGQLPSGLEIETIAVEGGTPDGVATDFGIEVRKADRGELEAVEELEYMVEASRLADPEDLVEESPGGIVPAAEAGAAAEDAEKDEPQILGGMGA